MENNFSKKEIEKRNKEVERKKSLDYEQPDGLWIRIAFFSFIFISISYFLFFLNFKYFWNSFCSNCYVFSIEFPFVYDSFARHQFNHELNSNIVIEVNDWFHIFFICSG